MSNRTQVMLSGVEKRYIAYAGSGTRQIIDADTPHEVPIGTVVRQMVTVLEDIQMADGTPLPLTRSLPLAQGPREFLRGRVVTGKDAENLLVPSFVRDLVDALGGMVDVVVEGEEEVRIVAIRRTDGTEVGIELRDNDVPPPADASPYPVGKSPEELAASVGVTAETVERRFCPNCLTDSHPVDPEEGLTEEEVQAELQRRAIAGAGMGGMDFPEEEDEEFDDEEDFDDDDLEDDLPTADAVEDDRRETGGEG